ncbi:preprotein translocase subunit [Geobacillus kaustophilus HTA426]|uniref:Protein translocase subunit SecE n=9 Tax=Geobacillus TaxID=129337 RepID=Q5L423_GEOKA|nr:preprotein translocase subunit SecE [Geobacillus sp. MAS1]BAD74376.1 preprotein translocase subunit [Geobacillus kaustophilus HTA426]
MMQRVINFLKEVVRELKKVSWPNRKELVNYTAVVLATVAFFTVFFAVVDLGISELIRLVFE